MAGYRRPWWVAGGWALDLVLGRKTRPHADLEISMLTGDQQALFDPTCAAGTCAWPRPDRH
jgi:hypothetical protein